MSNRNDNTLEKQYQEHKQVNTSMPAHMFVSEIPLRDTGVQAFDSTNSKSEQEEKASFVQKQREIFQFQMTMLQQGHQILKTLHGLCRSQFHGTQQNRTLLNPSRVKDVMHWTSKLRKEHLGLFNKPNLQRGIGYMHILEEENFSVGVFILAPGSIIPMHDHPNMCVVSNVLYGGVTVRSFDWENPDEDHSNGGLAIPVVHEKFTSPCTRVLYPNSGGNIHMFQADPVHGCAILDVLAPPYSDDHGRTCTYYSVARGRNGAEETIIKKNIHGNDVKLNMLTTYEPGLEFEVRPIDYPGPPMAS